LIEHIKAAIKDLENADYKEVIIESNEKAEKIKFGSSLTLLINEEDFEMGH
jgi:transcription elongation GreA/GreB family factor